jgi:hypothetical protein
LEGGKGVTDDQQKTLFDLTKGLQLKKEGKKKARMAKGELLERAREIARDVGEAKEFVTADDVQRQLIKEGHHPFALGNAAGSIFRGSEWEFTGRMVKSARISNHGHQNMVWRLKEEKHERVHNL